MYVPVVHGMVRRTETQTSHRQLRLIGLARGLDSSARIFSLLCRYVQKWGITISETRQRILIMKRGHAQYSNRINASEILGP